MKSNLRFGKEMSYTRKSAQIVHILVEGWHLYVQAAIARERLQSLHLDATSDRASTLLVECSLEFLAQRLWVR